MDRRSEPEIARKPAPGDVDPLTRYGAEDLECLLRLGYLLLSEGKMDDARAIFVGLVTLSGERPDFRKALALYYWRAGHIDNALAHLTSAVELDPMCPYAHLMRAELHIAAGRVKQARADLIVVLTQAPIQDPPLNKKARALYELVR
jgi:lipoprotein NlpI